MRWKPFLTKLVISLMESSSKDKILEAVVLILVAMAILPFMDGIAKELSSRIHPLQSVWARFFFQALFFVPVVLVIYKKAAFQSGGALLQIVRALAHVAATALFFIAIVEMPLADALALVFAAPLFVTALSPVVLGEKVGTRRWVATIVGFAGALLIIQPGPGLIGTGAPYAFGAGACFAGYLLLTRRASHASPPLVTMAWTAVVGTIAASILAVPYWTMPSPGDAGLMVALSMIGAVAHVLLIMAYARAPASFLAPFGYAEIVSATLIGYFWFGDFPSELTWAGMAVIVASGVYISYRERVVRRAGTR